MKISTKTLASLLAATASSSKREGSEGTWRQRGRLERLLRHHDRKCELRAELLGLSPQWFRSMQKKTSFESVVRQRGFLNEDEFMKALHGRIRAELHNRGWTFSRMNAYVERREQRLTAH